MVTDPEVVERVGLMLSPAGLPASLAGASSARAGSAKASSKAGRKCKTFMRLPLGSWDKEMRRLGRQPSVVGIMTARHSGKFRGGGGCGQKEGPPQGGPSIQLSSVKSVHRGYL